MRYTLGIVTGMAIGIALTLIAGQRFPIRKTVTETKGQVPISNFYDLGTKDEAQDYQIRQLKHRLDSLDGGKEKLWICHVYWRKDGTAVGAWPYMAPYSPTKYIVTTIGGETPKQLGYTNCFETVAVTVKNNPSFTVYHTLTSKDFKNCNDDPHTGCQVAPTKSSLTP